jgi:hypothetical protein
MAGCNLRKRDAPDCATALDWLLWRRQHDDRQENRWPSRPDTQQVRLVGMAHAGLPFTFTIGWNRRTCQSRYCCWGTLRAATRRCSALPQNARWPMPGLRTSSPRAYTGFCRDRVHYDRADCCCGACRRATAADQCQTKCLVTPGSGTFGALPHGFSTAGIDTSASIAPVNTRTRCFADRTKG